MPRPRCNDPLGVSDNPVVVTNTARIAELTDEFKRRLSYLVESYRLSQQVGLDQVSFNKSLAGLKRAVRRRRPSTRPQSRVAPQLEIAINHRARKLAGLKPAETLSPAHNSYVQQAAAEIANELFPPRKRPENTDLKRHVMGLMALIQETTGVPIVGGKTKNSVYDPQLRGAGGAAITKIFSTIDPTVTPTQLANIVREARAAYKGKPMRFLDFFPFYDAPPQPDGFPLNPDSGCRLVEAGIAVPIYCP